MNDAQTEARAIARWTRDAAGWVEWPDGEWVRYSDHTTALAANDAELAEARADALKVGDQMLAEKFRADRAKAQLAGARKALEQAEQQLDYGQVDAARRIIIRATHRAREQGGENNG